MPIYEYKCRQCGHYHEALQKMADPVLSDCPECGKPALKRLLSAPQFRLKGAGWYETDFKTGDKRNLHGEQKTASADKKDDKDKKSGAGKKTDNGSAKSTGQGSGQSSGKKDQGSKKNDS